MGLNAAEFEIAAAKALAARLGLGIVSPEIVKLAKHTTLKLNPLPIVARIQSSATPDLPFGSPQDELFIASHLAKRGAPTVRPTLQPCPHVQDGLAITLWGHVEGRPVRTRSDALKAVNALKEVHRALTDLCLELPRFTACIESCEAILSNDSAAPNLGASDRLFLRRLYREFRENLDRRALICRPLHGDTHFGNVLMTTEGAVWLDLEAVCTGPLEWDVVCLPQRYWSEFDDVDAALLDLLSNLRSICVATWCWAAFDRSAETREAAIYHLQTLKSRFG